MDKKRDYTQPACEIAAEMHLQNSILVASDTPADLTIGDSWGWDDPAFLF